MNPNQTIGSMRVLILLALFLALWKPVAGQESKKSVTFRVNLNGILGFSQPNLSGKFNNWCGTCQPLTNSQKDG
ncbi:MAG TPA: hypothetical protein PK509_15885, partial [Catalimonadaceae bacterium]|nr:hypothetical protein [Catalimonadaceae bacterium]